MFILLRFWALKYTAHLSLVIDCLVCNVKRRLQKILESAELCAQERGLQGVTPSVTSAEALGNQLLSLLWKKG